MRGTWRLGAATLLIASTSCGDTDGPATFLFPWLGVLAGGHQVPASVREARFGQPSGDTLGLRL